ncbi:hypothetical protein GCM10008012_19260 [Rhizobium anhuiense]|uniref:Uncharacterized protein n=1 Tax=Rhizobium anhuiense TaxID=1184720 RepID=A0A3S0RYX5_9HYPH|nr:hypothetical protein EEQ99_02360 [Rhizobium anhuiense]GGD75343.1 hypothetical protein GCM10008012_19260 [Rhizobium anhuiense]
MDFLNRVIDFAITSGELPRRFKTNKSVVEPDLGATIGIEFECDFDVVELFSRAGVDRRIGIHIEYSGSIRSRFQLDEWTFSGPAGGYSDPALDESFICDFSGILEATADVSISGVGGAQIATVRFGQLLRADLNSIGDLTFGPAVNAIVRQIFERIGVVRLRTAFAFPALSGLAGSLPAPANEIFGTPSGQFGTTDLKVVGGQNAATPDEIHVLLEADQNVGHQHYSDVEAFTDGAFDVGLAVGYRWTRQVLQDLWAGGAIPIKFDDHGRPDSTGKVILHRVDFTFMEGSLQIHAQIGREVIGIPLELDATLEVAFRFSNDLLFVDLLASNIDINLGWAKSAGWAAVFFVVRDVIIRLMLRGVNEALDAWSLPLLQRFLDGLGIDLRQRFRLSGTPFQIDLLPNAITCGADAMLFGCRINLSK